MRHGELRAGDATLTATYSGVIRPFVVLRAEERAVADLSTPTGEARLAVVTWLNLTTGEAFEQRVEPWREIASHHVVISVKV